MRVEEIIWSAGIAEGEGCFYAIKRQNGLIEPRFNVKMTDHDIIERMAKILNVGSIQRISPHNARHKTLWAINSSGPKAERFMWRVFPWLGNRRRARVIDIGLRLLKRQKQKLQEIS